MYNMLVYSVWSERRYCSEELRVILMINRRTRVRLFAGIQMCKSKDCLQSKITSSSDHVNDDGLESLESSTL